MVYIIGNRDEINNLSHSCILSFNISSCRASASRLWNSGWIWSFNTCNWSVWFFQGSIVYCLHAVLEAMIALGVPMGQYTNPTASSWETATWLILAHPCRELMSKVVTAPSLAQINCTQLHLLRASLESLSDHLKFRSNQGPFSGEGSPGIVPHSSCHGRSARHVIALGVWMPRGTCPEEMVSQKFDQ